jgi:hypothetical protein
VRAVEREIRRCNYRNGIGADSAACGRGRPYRRSSAHRSALRLQACAHVRGLRKAPRRNRRPRAKAGSPPPSSQTRMPSTPSARENRCRFARTPCHQCIPWVSRSGVSAAGKSSADHSVDKAQARVGPADDKAVDRLVRWLNKWLESGSSRSVDRHEPGERSTARAARKPPPRAAHQWSRRDREARGTTKLQLPEAQIRSCSCAEGRPGSVLPDRTGPDRSRARSHGSGGGAPVPRCATGARERTLRQPRGRPYRRRLRPAARNAEAYAARANSPLVLPSGPLLPEEGSSRE